MVWFAKKCKFLSVWTRNESIIEASITVNGLKNIHIFKFYCQEALEIYTEDIYDKRRKVKLKYY